MLASIGSQESLREAQLRRNLLFRVIEKLNEYLPEQDRVRPMRASVVYRSASKNALLLRGCMNSI